jgi:hypothetical protein
MEFEQGLQGFSGSVRQETWRALLCADAKLL